MRPKRLSLWLVLSLLSVSLPNLAQPASKLPPMTPQYTKKLIQNIDYAIGYAVADSPYGPWVKYKNNPIIHRSIVGENGSGHGDLFEGLDKQLYYVYHIHNSSDKVSPRRTRIAPVVFTINQLVHRDALCQQPHTQFHIL